MEGYGKRVLIAEDEEGGDGGDGGDGAVEADE